MIEASEAERLRRLRPGLGAGTFEHVATTPGAVLLEARTKSKLSVRELARRSGVSSGQISRIERGHTTTPSPETLVGLADALGRHRVALVALSGDEEAEHELQSYMEGWMDDRVLPQWLAVRIPELLNEESDSQAMKAFARDLFLGTPLLDFLDIHAIGDFDGRRELEQVVGSWTALTDERRTAVLAYVADQVRLSDLDRKHNAADPSGSDEDS